MDAGYSGCIRNLEINNKMYNFNSARSGGDVIDGNDIGKLKLPKAFVPPYDNEDQSDVSIALDGSTYPGRKMTRFSCGQNNMEL